MKRVLLLALVSMLLVPMAFAQRSTGPVTFPVTIQCNVQGADVSIDGKAVGKAPLTVALAAGDHSISVQAAGFQPYDGKFNVTQATTIPVNLLPATVSVTFSANVAGADISVSGPGSNITGKSPFTAQLLPGMYNVVAQAAGFKPLSMQANVSRDLRQTFALTLESARIDVALSCNVAGADVTVAVPGAPAIMGKAPLTVQLLPGQYTVTMSAAGYKPGSTQVAVAQAPARQSFALSLEQIRIDVSLSCNVAGADVSVAVPGAPAIMGKAPLVTQLVPGQYTVTMSAAGYKTGTAQIVIAATPQKQATSLTLEPNNATMAIVIPRTLLDPDSKDEGLLRSMVKIFLDGKLMNAKAEVLGSIPVAPGKHVIRLASGSLSFQQEFDFAPGGVYNLELAIGMTLKPATR